MDASSPRPYRSESGFDLSCEPSPSGRHVFEKPSVDPLRHCVHCGLQGRENASAGEGGGFMATATAGRSELFSRLRAPDSAHGKPRGSA